MKALCVAAGVVVLGFLAGQGAQRKGVESLPKAFEGARAEVYKRMGSTNLLIHIFEPAQGAASNRAAIVFFFRRGLDGRITGPV